jgi:hypothetical protein
MATERKERVERDPRYEKPPRSAQILNTEEFLEGINVAPSEDRALRLRAETVVYSIGMTPAKCRREDPYTGTQFIYDYVWCRTGPKPADKRRNLVLQFPYLSRRLFQRANPNSPDRKSSNWYLTATAHSYKDTVELFHP